MRRPKKKGDEMRLRADRVKVSVPATTMNFGPAYGSLGMALDRFDSATIRAIAGASRVRIVDADTGTQPEYWLEPYQVERHLSIRALRLLLDYVGAPQVGVALTYRRGIPADVGLGDREAQILVGLYGAWTLLGKPSQINETMLSDLATQLGASPVRTHAATNGGLVLGIPRASLDSQPEDDTDGPSDLAPRAEFLQFAVSGQVVPTALVPGFAMPDEDAATILPRAVSFRRSVANTARAAALVPLLTQALPRLADGTDGEMGAAEPTALELWREQMVSATTDDIVQLHRRSFTPASVAMVDWLAERKIAAFLSGAGPAVVCLWPPDAMQQRSISRAGWRVLVTDTNADGLILDD